MASRRETVKLKANPSEMAAERAPKLLKKFRVAELV